MPAVRKIICEISAKAKLSDLHAVDSERLYIFFDDASDLIYIIPADFYDQLG